ncbi:MAG: sulfotransferase [Ardenticatenaceae bacterium]|nr:sulfotransferase [Ardenticatenaceae bacterium]
MDENHKLELTTLSYIICATPRSGSTLLCEALRNSALAGNPDEYFGPMHINRWNKIWKTKSKNEYLGKVIEQGRGINGVLGLKVMRVYWQNVIEFLQETTKLPNSSESDILTHCFPNLRYIWITRRNKVRQAISWMKFLQGAAWFWEDEEPQLIRGLEFKPDVIREFIMQTVSHGTAWQEYFKQNGIQPYIVVYEDFVSAYEKTAKEILEYLGIHYHEEILFGERRLKQQADALTEEWVHRYLEMHRDTERM